MAGILDRKGRGWEMKDSELKEYAEYMENPNWREIVEGAPGERCREYIVHGLIHGFYAGFDPETCRDSLEDGLTAEDWKYVKRNLAGNDPYLLKCVTRIKELGAD